MFQVRVINSKYIDHKGVKLPGVQAFLCLSTAKMLPSRTHQCIKTDKCCHMLTEKKFIIGWAQVQEVTSLYFLGNNLWFLHDMKFFLVMILEFIHLFFLAKIVIFTFDHNLLLLQVFCFVFAFISVIILMKFWSFWKHMKAVPAFCRMEFLYCK